MFTKASQICRLHTHHELKWTLKYRPMISTRVFNPLSIGNSKYRYANIVQTAHSHNKTKSFIVLCCLHFSIFVHFLLFREYYKFCVFLLHLRIPAILSLLLSRKLKDTKNYPKKLGSICSNWVIVYSIGCPIIYSHLLYITKHLLWKIMCLNIFTLDTFLILVEIVNFKSRPLPKSAYKNCTLYGTN